MKKYCLLFCIIDIASQKKTADVTLNVHQRVNLLKMQIADQIDKQRTSELISPIDSDDEYTYVDIEKNPITPIMNFDQRKRKDKFKLKEIVTKPEGTPQIVARAVTGTRRRKHRVVKPLDSFYRRMLSDENVPIQWIHCQDLITPFFNGYKNDITVAKRLTIEDHSVLRLLELFNLNTTGHTKEEIYSILYQISNIQIRMFQWDVSAITSLLSVLIKDNKPHTFKNLISGVRSLLTSWHLDFGNTTNLLKQSRIFRPPCVRVSDYEGSTKTSRSVRYTKSSLLTSKSTCALPGDTRCLDDK